MKGPLFLFRCIPLVLASAFLVSGCSNADDVNAAFRQARVTWALFDPREASGFGDLAGFDQSVAVHWLPRDRAIRATGVAPAPGGGGAVAVSHLGLLLLDDQAGVLTSFRPAAKVSLEPYQTDGLFQWNGRLFLTLTQSPPGSAPPATLAWWAPGQVRLAFYPIPTQIHNPGRQAVAFDLPSPGQSTVGLTWKFLDGGQWAFDKTVVGLDGSEQTVSLAAGPSPEPVLSAAYSGLQAKVAQRLGAEAVVRAAVGGGPLLVFSESGWVAAQAVSDGRAHLFRLPDLGVAGRYTGAVFLSKGWAFTWETSFRGYAGASGLLHVPTPILAP